MERLPGLGRRAERQRVHGKPEILNTDQGSQARGFVYLAVVFDWFSRRVLSWRLSITMETAAALH